MDIRSVQGLEELAPAADLRPLGSTWRPLSWHAAPGLLVTILAAMASLATAGALGVPPMIMAVGMGALGAAIGLPRCLEPGVRVAATRLLRCGVVLLGFRLALGDLVALGPAGLVGVLVVVALTFGGTRWAGRWLGVSPGLSLLVATGFAICGASAIAAVHAGGDTDEDDLAYAVALVTLCGSMAIVVLPLLAPLVGFHDASFGAWVGASVHDVAQVVATASTDGPDALATATVVKLTRVVMLAPLVAGLALTSGRGRAHSNQVGASAPIGASAPTRGGRRVAPLVPGFVVGFVIAVGVRTIGVIPASGLDLLGGAERLCLVVAMVALGTGVRPGRFRRLGLRPLLLAAVAWVLVAGAAAGVVLVTNP